MAKLTTQQRETLGDAHRRLMEVAGETQTLVGKLAPEASSETLGAYADDLKEAARLLGVLADELCKAELETKYVIVKYAPTGKMLFRTDDGEWTKNVEHAATYQEGRQLEAAEETAGELGAEVVALDTVEA